MPKWFGYLLIVGFGAYSVVELVRLWLSGVTLKGWVEIAAFYGGMMTVLIVWIIADRRTCAKLTKDGPEADYHDPPSETR